MPHEVTRRTVADDPRAIIRPAYACDRTCARHAELLKQCVDVHIVFRERRRVLLR
jgi:hypothetical protein